MKSILKKLRNSMFLFGITMGIVFPIYAHFFVHWKEGMFPFFALGAIMAGITVGFANSLMVKHILVKRISEISDLSDRLASGDISQRLHLESNDQIGDIARHLNHFLDENQKDILSIKEQLETTTQEIDSLTSIASELERHVTQSTKNSLPDLVGHLTGLIENSSGVTDHLSSIKDSSHVISDEMSLLENTIKDISHKLQTISAIALKSKMLSLNAAIEASKYGNEGASFSVVADAMGLLATDTALAATTMIEEVDLLASHFNSANTTLSQIDTSVDQSQNQLNGCMGNLSEFSSQIGNVSEQLTQTGQSVISSVGELEHMKNNLTRITDNYS